MNGPDPETQPRVSGKKPSSWIPWGIAAAAIVALVVTLVMRWQAPAYFGPPPPPTPIPSHTVTIKPDGAGCAVQPKDLQDVGRSEVVRFENTTAMPVTIDFDAILFGVTSIAVPAGSSAKLMVSAKAGQGGYPYDVSCLTQDEARPRIVIRPDTGS